MLMRTLRSCMNLRSTFCLSCIGWGALYAINTSFCAPSQVTIETGSRLGCCYNTYRRVVGLLASKWSAFIVAVNVISGSLLNQLWLYCCSDHFTTTLCPSLTDYNLDSSADKDLKLYCCANHHNNCSISLKRPTMISAVSTAVVGALDWNCCDHMTSSEWGGVGRAVDVWHWYGSVGFQPFVDLLLPIKISSLSSVSPLPLPWPFWHPE